MTDDLTQKLPGDRDPVVPQVDDDKISILIIAVQSLSSNFQSLTAAVKEVEFRLEAVEKTAGGNLLETRPIWERALAEIVATRSDLAETRTELAETRFELGETRNELRTEMKEGFRKLSTKIELLNEDSLTLRGDQRLLERRVEALESKTPYSSRGTKESP